MKSGDRVAKDCGYRYDAETDNYYVRNRYYSPILGRWLTRDPIGYQGGKNLYEYCGGRPVTAIDPSENWGWGWVGLGAVAVVVALLAPEVLLAAGSAEAAIDLAAAARAALAAATALSAAKLAANAGRAAVDIHSTLHRALACPPKYRPECPPTVAGGGLA
jgi:RHS repeat-associated protein